MPLTTYTGDPMPFWDARMAVGYDHSLPPCQHASVDDARRMLDRHGIERAVMACFESFRLDHRYGNDLTFETAAKDERFLPCPTVVPNSRGEVGDEDAYVAGLVERGARCVGLFPETFGIALDPRVIGRLFEALQRRRMPVLVERAEASWLALADLAAAWPGLPVVALAPNYRHRNLFPLLEQTPNLYLTINPPFALNEGLEELAMRGLASRALFASGFPVAEPGATVAYLQYADIADDARRAMASENLRRLVEGAGHE